MIHKLLQALLVRVARLVHRMPGLILLAALALTAVSVWLTVTRLRVINNTDNLVSAKSTANRYYHDYAREFGIDEDYVVVIRSEDIEKNREVSRWIGTRIEAMQPEVRRVFYRLDFTKIEEHALFLLDPKDLEDIDREVSGFASQMKNNDVHLDVNSMLTKADAMFDDKYLRKQSNWKEFKPFVDHFADMLDKLATHIEAKPKLKSKHLPNGAASQAAQDKLQDISKEMEMHEYTGPEGSEGRTLIIAAMPGPITSDSAPYHATILKIRQLMAEARTLYPGIEIGLTGEPVLTDDEVEMSSRDSMIAGGLAFVLVALLFFVSYRERTRPVIALLVLAMAVSWSLGFTVISVGHLNIISQAFVAMVIGLGVDFGIQVMGRYEEELGRGQGIENALLASVSHTGAAVVTGGTTTALAFYTMCFNDFVGLREFGIVAGSGVALCLIANLVLLPACYVLMDRRKSPQVLRQKAAASSLPAERINRALFRFPAAILIAAVLGTAAAAWFLPRVRFDYNLLHLQNTKLESIREIKTLQDEGTSIILADSVADNVAQARERIARFQALPSVASINCPILDLTPIDADKKLAIIRHIVGSLQGIQLNTDVTKDVDVALTRAGIDRFLTDCQQGVIEAQKFAPLFPMAKEAVDVFSKLIPPLQRAQTAMKGLSQQELGKRLNGYQIEVFGTMQRDLAFLAHQKTNGTVTLDDIPLPLRERYLSPNGKILIEIAPKDNVWERGPDEQFVKELRTVDPRVTGSPVQNYEYIDLLRASYVQAAEYAAIAIVILIALHFGRPTLIALTILPLLLGIAWTLGLMGVLRYEFNPANVITLPLVIGIGVAYGVYTVDRFREDPQLRLFSSSTGKAIVLSALTAMIGFGSMMISVYPGLRSLGFLMFVGVGMCLLASIVVLPQILRKLRAAKGNAEAEKTAP